MAASQPPEPFGLAPGNDRMGGHEERFLPSRLRARSAFRKQTFAGTCGNEEDAPIAVLAAAPKTNF